MLEDFKEYLISTCHCQTDKNFLLTVSGGIDSVVMAHLFHTCGLKFSIAHCNFQLRGKESDGDQSFVQNLSYQYMVKFHTIEFDTTSYARRLGISIQMAARELRYNWFKELAAHFNYDFIAIAHNNNDIVETVLLNLSRGTGIRGLMGIRPAHKNIIRPLLFASRHAIEGYAKVNSLQWRDDSSNSETKYQRNYIRHNIIPVLEKMNPTFHQNTLNTIRRIDQTGRLLDFFIDEVKKKVWTELHDRILIDINRLREFPENDLLLFELLKDYGSAHLSTDMLINVMNSETGRQLHTPLYVITRNRNNLIITAKTHHELSEIIIHSDVNRLDQPIGLSFSLQDKNETFVIPEAKNIAALDADKIKYPLLLRTWKKGDRFYPLGMEGSKKLSDFLINSKIPLPDKKDIYVLESEGKIAWIVNNRIDNRFRVTENTSKILLIEYKN